MTTAKGGEEGMDDELVTHEQRDNAGRSRPVDHATPSRWLLLLAWEGERAEGPA